MPEVEIQVVRREHGISIQAEILEMDMFHRVFRVIAADSRNRISGIVHRDVHFDVSQGDVADLPPLRVLRPPAPYHAEFNQLVVMVLDTNVLIKNAADRRAVCVVDAEGAP